MSAASWGKDPVHALVERALPDLSQTTGRTSDSARRLGGIALGAGRSIDVTLDDGWVALQAPSPLPHDASPSSLLACAGRWPCAVELFIGDDAVEVRSELRVDGSVPADDGRANDDASTNSLRDRVDRMTAACRMSPTDVSDEAAPPRTVLPEREARAAALAQRMQATGWRMDMRDDGSCMVDLDAGERFAQANVSLSDEGDVRARYALPHAATDASREAVAWLALRAASTVRLVGARSDASGAPRLEVGLPDASAASALEDALAALSVAVRRIADEAALLAHDEALAVRFLALGGAASLFDGAAFSFDGAAFALGGAASGAATLTSAPPEARKEEV